MPEGLGVEIKRSAWHVPPVFTLLQEIGKVEENEMLRTFNMGIGFILIVHPEDEKQVTDILKASAETLFGLAGLYPDRSELPMKVAVSRFRTREQSSSLD